ncbi:MAG: hypothetical protein RIT27_1183 [Pseudomonadota bacterium]
MVKSQLLFIISVLLISGCSRSISDANNRYSSLYGGELNDLDVLGVNVYAEISDDEISKILETRSQTGSIKLKEGDKVLLIQSGAMIPDEIMVNAISKYYVVTPFTGIPQHNKEKDKNAPVYSKSLRYAAATAGIETIIVYWGVIDTETDPSFSKTISWIPILGNFVPDEEKRMNIRLKVAIIDVKTGKWELISSKGFLDSSYSSYTTRNSVDQNLVKALKEKTYPAAVEEIVKYYSK